VNTQNQTTMLSAIRSLITAIRYNQETAPVLLAKALRNKDKRRALISFLVDKEVSLSVSRRIALITAIERVEWNVPCPHTLEEILEYCRCILSTSITRPGVIVEAGCFQGGSTCKFSLAARLAQREMVIFDSFQGIPPNSENHVNNIYGSPAEFLKGDWCGSLDTVRNNVLKYGAIEVCRFVPGWFEDTMITFKEPVAAAYIDVDLASSTRTCLKYLYPLLQPGGVLFSQDGHLPLVLEVFRDKSFWIEEIGCEPPYIEGIGVKKLLRLVKPLPTPESL
jgi:O-methyltransferase